MIGHDACIVEGAAPAKDRGRQPGKKPPAKDSTNLIAKSIFSKRRSVSRRYLGGVFAVGMLAGASLMLLPNEFRSNVGRIVVSVLNGMSFKKQASVSDLEAYIRMNNIDAGLLPKVGLPSGPLRVSPINPRYFIDNSGKTVYLAGSHTWLNLQDGDESNLPAKFDYETWLNLLQSQGHNFFRLWTWEQAKWTVEASTPYYFSPQPYLRISDSKDAALDGRPKFDLSKFNEEYFERLRERVAAAGRRGIYVSVMLFNGWSIAYPKGQYKENNPWNGHPFNRRNNINGIDGDLNADGSGDELHEGNDSRIIALQEAYLHKVIDTVNDFDNVLYEISNESHSTSAHWQYHMIDYIHKFERSKPNQHPVGMTGLWPHGDNAALYASNADWISPNGSLHDRPTSDGKKVIVSDTDHLCGICGDRKWVWMSFMRGENLLFMDRYDGSFPIGMGRYNMLNANDIEVRKNIGYTRHYAERLNMATMTPRSELATSGYVLASSSTGQTKYLVYLPEGGAVTVDMRSAVGVFDVEWFNPMTGLSMSGGSTSGGVARTFIAPFGGDATLYISNKYESR